ncbi:LOW QUALITY PROTEIN: hypothetical protein M8C21_031320, partial [Ambrosia artemisiifolia]
NTPSIIGFRKTETTPPLWLNNVPPLPKNSTAFVSSTPTMTDLGNPHLLWYLTLAAKASKRIQVRGRRDLVLAGVNGGCALLYKAQEDYDPLVSRSVLKNEVCAKHGTAKGVESGKASVSSKAKEGTSNVQAVSEGVQIVNLRFHVELIHLPEDCNVNSPLIHPYVNIVLYFLDEMHLLDVQRLNRFGSILVAENMNTGTDHTMDLLFDPKWLIDACYDDQNPPDSFQCLKEKNERLFYNLLVENIEEVLSTIYVLTVEACQKLVSSYFGNNWLEKKY